VISRVDGRLEGDDGDALRPANAVPRFIDATREDLEGRQDAGAAVRREDTTTSTRGFETGNEGFRKPPEGEFRNQGEEVFKPHREGSDTGAEGVSKPWRGGFERGPRGF
jgi:hypothetical protein